ncbi:uncharacterized protein LOC113215299 [Frankliniella occidentalis]|uniref:Uncharacterized protein LOC113215299 n=1 Tax=Frankliniella occidentalis TaxID=133901 RepID=A0A6J1TD44_FRAOC|nr:uncharacterized protein LOC113215299 [Frankliniella occidentalis]
METYKIPKVRAPISPLKRNFSLLEIEEIKARGLKAKRGRPAEEKSTKTQKINQFKWNRTLTREEMEKEEKRKREKFAVLKEEEARKRRSEVLKPKIDEMKEKLKELRIRKAERVDEDVMEMEVPIWDEMELELELQEKTNFYEIKHHLRRIKEKSEEAKIEAARKALTIAKKAEENNLTWCEMIKEEEYNPENNWKMDFGTNLQCLQVQVEENGAYKLEENKTFESKEVEDTKKTEDQERTKLVEDDVSKLELPTNSGLNNVVNELEEFLVLTETESTETKKLKDVRCKNCRERRHTTSNCTKPGKNYKQRIEAVMNGEEIEKILTEREKEKNIPITFSFENEAGEVITQTYKVI